MTLNELRRLVAQGENHTVEFKRTTGELREGLEALCAFLNTEGGSVLFGVDRKGRIEGQQVSEQTIHELTDKLTHFEPPAPVDIERVKLGRGRELIALSARSDQEGAPYTLEGRAFERSGNTTRRMSQHRYESLLLERAHARRRWENQPAVDVKLGDLDREEILRTRELAIQQHRISAGSPRGVGELLDRLKLRRNGVITQAAQILYGKEFLPDYPQGLLKLGRTLPLSARFPKGTIFREDRLPVPADALREILLNAVMHRDYAQPNSYVAVAVFDDRIEIRSVGTLPAGVTLDMLSKRHLSRPRNPLIAGAFHLTGAVEVWGRGTNRVIEACRKHGIPPPAFEERSGCLIVTFKATVAEARPSAPPAAPQDRAARDAAVLKYAARHGSISRRQFIEPFDKSRETARRELQAMVQAGRLAQVGRGRSVKYVTRGERIAE